MLSRLALRICTVEALRGNTQMADNVLDSQITALDVAGDTMLRTDQDRPFIAIYTDESAITRDKRGEQSDMEVRALHRSGITDLVIEFGITAAMTDIDEDTGESRLIGIGFPATDANMEAFLDIAAAQIVSVLNDPKNEWSELRRRFSSRIVGIVRRRTSDSSGTRIAAHQIIISLDLLADPVLGQPLSSGGTYSAFLAKMEATGHPWLEQFKNLIGDADKLTRTHTQRRFTGETLFEARAIADFPPVPAEETEPDFTDVRINEIRSG